MPLRDYVTGAQNKILMGGTGIGLIITTVIGLGYLRPALRVNSPHGVTLFEISGSGAIGVNGDFGDLDDCLKSGGSSGKLMTFGECGSGGGGSGTNSGNVLTLGDARYVRKAGDTMTGALVIQNGNTHSATTTPLLNVRGTMSGKQLFITGSGGSTIPLISTSNGRIGIGTASPLSTFDVRVPLENGLIGWFAGDEGGGTYTFDKSVTAGSGKFLNGATVATGKNGRALSFDGNNDYVTLGANNRLSGQQVPVTITGWFKQSSTTGNRILYSAYQSAGSHQLWSMVRLESGVLTYYTSTANGSYQGAGSLTAAANQWHHFAIVVSGTTAAPRVTFYLDNKTQTANFSAVSATPDLTVPISIGANYAGGEPFAGLIDELRIYNRELNAREVAELARLTQLSLVGGTTFGELRIDSGASLNVSGLISGATLMVSGNSMMTGTLLARGNISTRGTLSGAALTIMNGNSYLLGSVAIGKTSVTTGNKFEVVGTISGSALRISGSISASGAVMLEGALSGATINGFGLGNDCDGTSNKITWDVTTQRFKCETDQTGGAAGLVDHYVLASGDTMTGTLVIQNGTTHSPTATPLLNVRGTMSGRHLRLSGTGASPVLMTDTKRVGIGTSSPAYTLDLVSTEDAPTVRFRSTSTVYGPQFLLDASGAGGREFRLVSTPSGNPTIGSNKFAIYDTTGGAYRFMIDSSGYVGIGDNLATETERLTVAGAISVQGAAAGSTGLVFSDESGYKRIQSYDSELLSLNPVGNNVAVGKTSAAAKLDVLGIISGSILSISGNASFTGAVVIKGNNANKAALNVLGTASGSILYATQTIRSSGSIVLEGMLSGATISGFGLSTDCDGTSNKLTWDVTTQRFKCEADQSGGAGTFGSGNVLTIGDNRYVNTSGDTMTGALVIQNGNTHTSTAAPLLSVRGVMSGYRLVVSGNATITGSLLATGNITSRGTISGALITQNGAGDNYFMGGIGIGNSSLLPLSAGNGAASQTPSLQVLGTGADDSSIGVARFSNSANGPKFIFLTSRNTTIGGKTIVQSNDSLGQLIFSADNGVDYLSAGAKIEAIVDGTPGASSLPTRMVFSTTPTGLESPVERVRITNAGRIGIGASSPAAQLSVSGSLVLSAQGNVVDSRAAKATLDVVGTVSGSTIYTANLQRPLEGCLQAYGQTTAVATGTGGSFDIPASATGSRLYTMRISHKTSGNGTTSMKVERSRPNAAATAYVLTSMLSTNISTDSGELNSTTAATPYVVATTEAARVQGGDKITFNITAVPGTPPKGLDICFTFLPK